MHTPESLEQLLNEAFALHQDGNLVEAQALYKTIIEQDNTHANAFFLLGLTFLQQDDYSQSVRFISSAISVNPDVAEYYNHLATALYRQGRIIDSIVYLQKAIFIDPNNAEAYFNLGNIYLAQEKYQDAIDAFNKALSVAPKHEGAQHNLANCLLKLERYQEASDLFSKLLLISHNMDYFKENISCLIKLEKHNEVKLLLENHLAQYPNDLEMKCELAFTLQNLGHYEDASSVYKEVIATKPSSPIIYYNFGRVLHALHLYHDAIIAYQQAVLLGSSNSKTFFNLGNAYHEIKRYKEAIFCYEKACSLKPDYVAALGNWGNALFALHNFDDAIALYNRALDYDPQDIKALFNRALAFSAMRNPNAAVSDLKTVIALRPDYATAHFELAWCYLLFGYFHKGWAKFESRLTFVATSQQPASITGTLWRGEPLAEKTLLLWFEGSENSGFGESIHFIRYVKLLKALDAKVIVLTQSLLVSLFKNMPGIERVIDAKEDLPFYDYHCPIMSLAHRFDTNLTNIPSDVPYLFCTPTKKQKWLPSLTNARLIVGIVWRGIHEMGRSAQRYIALNDLLSVFDERVLIVILQMDITDDERELLNTRTNVLYASDSLTDFDDTAALIDSIDLVISIDNSVAHLTGALAKPLWLLLHELSDWRWLLDRSDSPWYPTARLFRQKINGDWSNVIDELSTALNSKLSSFH